MTGIVFLKTVFGRLFYKAFLTVYPETHFSSLSSQWYSFLTHIINMVLQMMVITSMKVMTIWILV